MITGIYKIVSPDGSVYIGQSVDIEKRFAQHRRNRSKDYSKLKSSFNYYGPYNHRFEILEECDTKELNERERYWFNHYSETGCDMLNSISIPYGETKKKEKQKWKPIPGCSNYAIGSYGQVKRLRHRARGKNHKILKEQIVKQIYDRYWKPTVRIIGDDGKQHQLSVEKLVITQFLEPGRIYYKTTSDNMVNRIDRYVDAEAYEKMKYKPNRYKIVKT